MELEIPLFNYQANLKLKTDQGKRQIFDPIRKKYLVLQPEELVRQLWVQYLIHDLNCPAHLIAIEQKIVVNGLTRRYDIVVYNRSMEASILIECKAPQVGIRQSVFDQIAQYNMVMKVPYLVVSNGRQTYACSVDWEKEDYKFITTIPDFENLER